MNKEEEAKEEFVKKFNVSYLQHINSIRKPQGLFLLDVDNITLIEKISYFSMRTYEHFHVAMMIYCIYLTEEQINIINKLNNEDANSYLIKIGGVGNNNPASLDYISRNMMDKILDYEKELKTIDPDELDDLLKKLV